MKILDERKPDTKKFEEVTISEVFYVECEADYGTSPYMRIFAVEDSDYCQLNAVDLKNGQVVRVEDDEPVILCKAILRTY